MYPGQRKATLQDQAGYGIRKSSGSQRRASTFADSNPGPFSAPVARLSKWPKNIFFASDFIAEKAAAATSTSARRRRPRQRTSFSTDARVEERDRRTSTGSHSHEPVPRHRVNQGAAACRSSDSREEAPQSAQREESRPDVARGEEGGTLTFLEESASALLLLHSRFFGGVRQEEDIVCRLCMLCREAGWMGNPLTASPDLDPLVLEKMVLARLRRTDQSSTNSLLHSEDEVFSFEAFYRVLADVATLVYPREGKAMRRLLLEGVLPLAADNEPRMWSPRPEVLYGRPALAALRMQRHALHQLYCTYESIARTEKDADGISRGIFLKMLAHLGVTPVSVSEQHAASVFDDALRNGLAVAEPPFSREQRERRKGTRAIPLAGKGREHPLEVGNRARVPFSSSRPWDNRLCWSNFLEAMAALAVGAVKGGHAIDTATTKRRKSTPVCRPANSFTGGLEGDLGEPGEDIYTCQAPPRPRARSPGEGRYPERRVPSRVGAEVVCAIDDEAGETETGQIESEGRRGVPSTGGRSRPDLFSEERQQATYGGDFYHDSRRGVELLPTLRELDAPLERQRPDSTVRSQPPSSLQHTPHGEKEDTGANFETIDTRRAERQPSATTCAVTRRVEGCERKAAKTSHFGQTKTKTKTNSRVVRYSDDLPKGAAEYSSMEHRPTVETKESTGDAGAKNEQVDWAAMATAVVGVGSSIPKELVASNQMTSPQATVAQPNAGTCTTCTPDLSPDASGRARTARAEEEEKGVLILHVNTATEAVDEAVQRGQELIGLYKRRGTLAPRHVTASNDAASADVPPANAHISAITSPEANGNDTSRGLSPAPYHGGSLLAVQVPSSKTPAASEDSTGPYRCASVCVQEGERPAQPFQALENHADDEDASCLLRSWQSTSVLVDPSSGGGGGQSSETICRNKHSAPPTGEKMIQEKPLRSGWGRDGRRRSEGLGGNGSAPPREGFTERRQEEPDHGGAPIDDATMNFEAASATIFDELLDPRVVAVYSSHRKELQALFQRYSTSTSAGSGNPDGDGFRYVSMKIGDAGIWRFVGEFPVLLRWAEGDSILRLILRASCNRGWHRCGKGGEEAAEQPLGLTYFGFLEVVTRMAYASRDRRPLHGKLLSFISALRMDDPHGIFRS